MRFSSQSNTHGCATVAPMNARWPWRRRQRRAATGGEPTIQPRHLRTVEQGLLHPPRTCGRLENFLCPPIPLGVLSDGLQLPTSLSSKSESCGPSGVLSALSRAPLGWRSSDCSAAQRPRRRCHRLGADASASAALRALQGDVPGRQLVRDRAYPEQWWVVPALATEASSARPGPSHARSRSNAVLAASKTTRKPQYAALPQQKASATQHTAVEYVMSDISADTNANHGRPTCRARLAEDPRPLSSVGPEAQAASGEPPPTRQRHVDAEPRPFGRSPAARVSTRPTTAHTL
mmetsp:Transcript_27784/g.49280  ORF Transcript_27784/g.49280 Transcript_27784/m.49280 type:complete len:291 (+) Transcript_27784:84-956(+)